MLRKLLDQIEPLFHKGGVLEKLYPLYEANDTFLYTPSDVTKGATHVRDAIDTKRMMTMVIIALLPCIFMACYNTGYQAQKTIAATGFAPPMDHGFVDALWSGSWRYNVMDFLGIDYTSDRGAFLNPMNIIPCFLHGLLFFLPVYLVCMVVGGHCELIFSIIRKHEINEGFLVTGMLFPLTLPPTIPLWQVAIGIAFGVVVGKEIFGGTGRNFLNPALTARAFLYFAYPTKISGDKVWTAVGGFEETANTVMVDGYTGATVLGYVANSTAADGTVNEIIQEMGKNSTSGTSWWDFFIGNVHGSMGETSTLACLIGAAILIACGIGSWRIMGGVLIGMVAFSSLLMFGEQPVWNLGPMWHLVIGGFAFGTVFMATDPVSASMTRKGKWVYGFMIGFLTVLVRAVNPAFPEGIMLAILFANVFAPLIDYFVVEANVKRRASRYAT
jgi:Na+-transporting NADH:ubiquinone oxidoreductase subunit B